MFWINHLFHVVFENEGWQRYCFINIALCLCGPYAWLHISMYLCLKIAIDMHDYDNEMNLLRHKYMWINIMLYAQLYSHILKMWYVT